MRKWYTKAASVAVAAALVTGCSMGGEKNDTAGEATSLKVMYYDESSFFQDYGMLFSALYPKVEIDVVTTQSLYRGQETEGEEFDRDKAMQDLIDAEKPDVLLLNTNEYEKMAQDGKLQDLEAFMTKDKFDTEGLIPGMVDHMKKLSGGQLYGLPTSFYSQVIYYNKDLFDKFNISYPTDKMTWDQVINLARMFPVEGEKDERVYGLKAGYSGNLSDLTQMLAQSEGLKYVNPATKEMSINTDGWKKAVQTAKDALDSNALYFEDGNNWFGGGSYEDYIMRKPFISGKLAMTIESSYFMNEIEEAANYVKDPESIVSNWDMVTVPVSTQYPDQSGSINYNNIIAISKDSPNTDMAWKFVSYISGDEYARVKAKVSGYNGFPIRTKYIEDENNRNVAAFYALKPSDVDPYKDYDKLPMQFGMMFNDYMQQEFNAIKEGTKSVDEALELLQVKGEELLAQEEMTEEEFNKMIDDKMREEMGEMSGEAGSSAGVEVSTETAE
ncbi:extracellular solute-binding protein [Paenibacillus sp. J5C_2022]|uniref:ABC transporter substrate-binding protein n=1 Tax=Paenibacillus sp. J5C2022 TaxID=2977129 RepID=UPI0021D0862C|nr:extracellular solute-binding protein [Paenibacillus sp. J5C2022]MCU6711777.1 extracellular solute-binding protein [Paenibacillus sp. J5C2022]